MIINNPLLDKDISLERKLWSTIPWWLAGLVPIEFVASFHLCAPASYFTK